MRCATVGVGQSVSCCLNKNPYRCARARETTDRRRNHRRGNWSGDYNNTAFFSSTSSVLHLPHIVLLYCIYIYIYSILYIVYTYGGGSKFSCLRPPPPSPSSCAPRTVPRLFASRAYRATAGRHSSARIRTRTSAAVRSRSPSNAARDFVSVCGYFINNN